MRYDYKDPTELDDFNLAEGRGAFVIRAAYDKDRDGAPLTDKNGADMLKLELEVTDATRKSATIYCYLTGSYPRKIKQLVDSIGMPHLYGKDGDLSPRQISGRKGECIIFTEPASGQYKARSAIKEFVAALPSSANSAPQTTTFEDDIPF